MKKYESLKGLSCIYVIKNTINDKIYIGSSINVFNRIKDHFKELKRNNHKNQLLQNHYNKYGECFYFEVLKEIKNEYLIEVEQFYMDTFKSYERDKGFNINKKANSMLGFKFSKESKKKMSESRLGKKFSNDAKGNMSLSKQGSKHPRSKLKESDVLEIRNNYDNTPSYSKRMADKYKVSWCTINYILKRKTWKHI